MSQGFINLSPCAYCFVAVLFSVSVHLLTNLILFTDYEVITVIINSKINVLIRKLITPFCYKVTLCFLLLVFVESGSYSLPWSSSA